MSILELLADYNDGRIVSFELSPDRKSIVIREECDGYFSMTLGKKSFGEMIEELKALHAEMVDDPQRDGDGEQHDL